MAELKRIYIEGGGAGSAPGEEAEEQPERPTYGALFAEWRAAIATSVKQNTLRHYDTAITKWLNPYLEERPISAGDYRFLQQLFNEQISPRFAPSTVHNAYSVLRQALDYAVEPGQYIADNPAARIRLPKLQALNPSIALGIDELLALLRSARSHRYGSVIFFAALTGARLGECLGIQQGDVDLQRNTLHITRQLNILPGRGIAVEALKTPGSDRLLPSTPRLVELLEQGVAERRAALQYLGRRETAGGWYFLNTKGDLLRPRLVEEAFDAIVEDAGLAEIYPVQARTGQGEQDEGKAKKRGRTRKRCAVSFHDLRSTLLTQLGDLGVDETTRARIAGHGPKNVTQHYDRSTLKRMHDALVAVEKLVLRN